MAGTASAGLAPTAAELVALQTAVVGWSYQRRRPSTAVFAGAHRSRFKGRGVDFVESRNYLVGDDIRNLDWRVTARTGRPHTKVFEEERERPTLMVVDYGSSMFFGTRERLKSVQAARVAAALAWLVTSRGDRVGALVHGDRMHHELKPYSGRRGALRLIDELVRMHEQFSTARDESDSSGFDTVLQRARRVARPGSLIILISDFSGLERSDMPLMNRLQSHNEVVAIQVVDRLEVSDLPPGLYPASDGRQRGILQPGSIPDPDAKRELLRRNGVPAVQVLTHEAAVKPIGELFR